MHLGLLCGGGRPIPIHCHPRPLFASTQLERGPPAYESRPRVKFALAKASR